ncbi:ABC transporter permease [Rathayibacter sp. KR2-224]|uniref:ABC transporter permease n=1 Tax=Rathayibacter sp. KR2-224 TaxID=3400913 RepID=UPI003C0132B7
MNALGALVRFRLRRDRVVGTAWVVVIALSILFVVAALASTYGTPQLRTGVVAVLTANPTLLAVRGAPDGASAGAFFMTEIGAFMMMLVAFMNTFTAVRHTRADEEQGRSDLIVATRAGRASTTWATVIHAVVLNLAMGVLAAVVSMASGYDAPGSLAFGWALVSTGLAFFGVGLLTAQIFSTSRAANGWAIAVIAVFWVLNAAADAGGTASADRLHITPSPAVWFTPVGWGLRIRPFTQNDWWIGLLSIALAAVLVAVAFWLQSVRDTSSGLVSPRRGRASAPAILRGPVGLAWRLQRASIIGWGIAAVVGGLLIAGLGKTLNDAVASNPEIETSLKKVGSGSGSVLEVFLGVMAALIGLLVAGAAVQTVIRLRQEEAATNAETVLATPVSRLRWYLSFVIVAVVASAVILALSGAVMGGALSAIDGRLAGQAVALATAQLPAVAVYLAVTAFVFGVFPRATAAVGWTAFGIGVVIGEFGALFGLPDWVRGIAPTDHTPTVPLSTADWSGTWIMAVLAVVLVAAGALAFSRRGIVAN